MRYIFAVLLALLSTPATAWDVTTFKDRMTDRTETVATVQSGDATLEVGCMNGSVQPWLTFSQHRGRGNVGVSYRFDDGPVVPRFAFMSAGTDNMYIWSMDYAEAVGKLRKGKRLRVQIGQAFYDFDLTKGDALPNIKCAH
jgi:hypothetical protein